MLVLAVLISCGLISNVQASDDATRSYREMAVFGDRTQLDAAFQQALRNRPNSIIIYCGFDKINDEHWQNCIRKIMPKIYPWSLMVKPQTDEEMQRRYREAFSQVTPTQKLRWALEAAQARTKFQNKDKQ